MSMTALPRTLAFSFALAFAGSTFAAFAQEATPAAPAAPAPTTTVDTTAPAADDLSMGVENNTPPAPLTQETAAEGQIYQLAAFDSWSQRCTKMKDGSDPCELYQLLKDKEGTNVAEISMFPLPAGAKAASGATIIAPLETLLTANLVVAVDTSKPKVYPFTFCAQLGCVARVGFTAEEIAQFKKGSKATITIVPAAAPDQKVDLDVSLKGFTAGYDAVASTMPK
ncbi:invasion associated locus B family protein [Cypionkella sp.]|uniref:invasion associated locus B family protein n=1 Tax=Cypionkella sp. TaxID=2811411 RepID=UPI00260C2140|nr:invasion associated locus B family protein [Cypionkella sp.]MDB5666247.1 Invasion-associated locus family protein [Cypionkella sp.]